MALHTFGTAATTSLSAVQFSPDPAIMSDSDLAALNALIKPNYLPTQEDTGGANSGYRGVYLDRSGLLNVPGRGTVKVFPGDWVCVDPTAGWPFILSQSAVSSGPYSHS